MQILAKKMDKLMDWGVLVMPETIGVIPEFVSPSMLLPKVEPNEWRLVTDFSALNTHIRKLPSINPTVQEAKEFLAKKRFHVEIDLSNYFYQGGMRVADSQYLGTPHPYKGIVVYATEPQGLKNA